MTRNPDLHRAPLGYGKNGPLTWVAECRVPRGAPGETRLAMARWMIENGSDVHQGGDGPLMRAALDDERIPMMELLVAHGADVNALWDGRYPIVCAPVRDAAPRAPAVAARPRRRPARGCREYGSPLSMVVGTYSRNAEGKHACLEVFAKAGFALPDTPAMALHRGRIDLLREPSRSGIRRSLARRFTEAEIYPAGDRTRSRATACTATPVAGATLLHLAIEYDDMEIARWLMERGADVNAALPSMRRVRRAHAAVPHRRQRWDDRDAKGAASAGARRGPERARHLPKQLRDMGDPEKEQMREFHDVTPTGYARSIQEPAG